MAFNQLIYQAAQVMRWVGFSFHEEADPRVQAMQKKIRELGSIAFSIEVSPDGAWAAESKNISGIITGGDAKDSIHETIKDAVFTYFEIPPYLCDDRLVKGSSESIKLEQRVYV